MPSGLKRLWEAMPRPIQSLIAMTVDRILGHPVPSPPGAPTDAAVTAAAEAMSPNPDGTFSPDWENDDEDAYALPLLVYAAMPTCGIDAETKTQMDKVMTYAVGAGQQNLPPGNVALPKPISEVARKQLAAWRSIAKAAPCTPVATTTTSTTAPTTTVPASVPEGDAFVPPADVGSGDGGVYTDPSLGGGSVDPGTATPVADAAAAPTDAPATPATPVAAEEPSVTEPADVDPAAATLAAEAPTAADHDAADDDWEPRTGEHERVEIPRGTTLVRPGLAARRKALGVD